MRTVKVKGLFNLTYEEWLDRCTSEQEFKIRCNGKNRANEVLDSLEGLDGIGPIYTQGEWEVSVIISNDWDWNLMITNLTDNGFSLTHQDLD